MKKLKRRQSLFHMALAVILTLSSIPLSSFSVVAADNGNTIPEGYKAVYTIEDLYAIRNNLGGNYFLMNDIDMSEATAKGGGYDSGTGWNPIGTAEEGFHGTFDGNGHKIIGMHIFGEFIPNNQYDVSVYLGLFSGIDGGGSVKNLGMTDCSINVTAAQNMDICTGCIAGNAYPDANDTFIQNCYTDGMIQAQADEGGIYAGGLLGNAFVPGGGDRIYISDNYNMCDITCSGKNKTKLSAGGILGAGEPNAKLERCYNTGKISNGSITGAICGQGDEFTEAHNCFYLKGTANQGIAGGSDRLTSCTALTDTQMKSNKSFTKYNFTETWEIDPNCSYKYPQLKNNRMVKILSIKLLSLPEKTTYNQGEGLNADGALLEIAYEDGLKPTVPVTLDMLSNYDMNFIGRQTVIINYGDAKASFDIEVKEIPVKKVKLPDKLTLYCTEQQKLDLKIIPENATNKSVSWKSSHPKTARIKSDGTVKAISSGTAVITAVSANGQKASCTITVLDPKKTIQKTLSTKAKIKSAKNIKGKQLKLKLTGGGQCDGYKVQYGLKKNFKGAKTLNIKSGTANIKKLRLKKTYYIRAKVYKKISGKIYYGTWSGTKSVNIKK